MASHPPSEPYVQLSLHTALQLLVREVSPFRQFSIMKQLMTFDAQDQRLPAHLVHQLLPFLSAILYALHLINEMNLDQSLTVPAVLTSL